MCLKIEWIYSYSHLSVVSMGGCSLALTMVFYATEALYFRSSTLNFYVIFPCVLNSEYRVLFYYTYHREWSEKGNTPGPCLMGRLREYMTIAVDKTSLSLFSISNNFTWLDLHTQKTTSLGTEYGHGRWELSAVETDDWLQETSREKAIKYYDIKTTKQLETFTANSLYELNISKFED